MVDLVPRLLRDNADALGTLIKHLRAPTGGVIPFVGAGMSNAFGFPTWERFLREEADGSEEILSSISVSEYIDAAQALEKKMGPDAFQRRISVTFGSEPAASEVKVGPLRLLAFLAAGPVITTNLDHVLECVFAAADNAFEEVIRGPQLDSIVSAIQTGRHVLIKLHGDAMERTSRTFTLLEYEETYIKMPDLALLMFGNRPLLFLGASLKRDRTVGLLEDVHKRLPGVRHFALVADDEPEKTREALDACGISPVWYPAGDFDVIEDHLWSLHDGVAGHTLQPEIGQAAISPSGPGAVKTFEDLPRRASSEVMAMNSLVVTSIARAARSGNLAFVLSAQSHRSRLIELLPKDPDISGFFDNEIPRAIIASQGDEAMLDAVKALVTLPLDKATVRCDFLAALPAFLRSTGLADAAELIIISTDYGTLLEQSFEAKGEPFHLLYYCTSESGEGSFLHRSPGGAISTIERPETIVGFRQPATVIVKLRGGVLHGKPAAGVQIRESICFEESDIVHAAGNVLSCLPRGIRLNLRARRLLLLGYGLLNDPDVNAIVRSRAAPSSFESWSFDGAGGFSRDHAFWNSKHVHTSGGDPDAAVLGLHKELLRAVRASDA